jgi:hypothetical protein
VNDESAADRDRLDRCFRARTIAIAKGRAKLAPGEPKIWFSSAQSIGKLINDNWPLLQEIRRRTGVACPICHDLEIAGAARSRVDHGE